MFWLTLKVFLIRKLNISHINSPEKSFFMSHISPKYIFILHSRFGKFLNIIPTKSKCALFIFLISKIETKYRFHFILSSHCSHLLCLLNKGRHPRHITLWPQPNNATKLIMLNIRCLINGQEDSSINTWTSLNIFNKANIILTNQTINTPLPIAMC